MFNEYWFYSPLLDAEACRLSVADERGGEFFMIVASDDSKGWRARRNEALDVIEEAIARGLQPGEVRLG